jgi:hypothetical protein
MVLINLPADAIFALGLSVSGYDAVRQRRLKRSTLMRRFYAWFGVGPETCRVMFLDVQGTEFTVAHINQPNIKYLLMAQCWMKLYGSEEEISGIFGLHVSTVRSQVEMYLFAIHSLFDLKVSHFERYAQN